MTYKNILLSFTLLITALIAAWLTLSHLQGKSVVAAEDELPDAYMEDVNATIMNKQGKISMKIATPKMTHYATNDTADLERPELTVYRNALQPWYISSKSAKTIDGIEKINFQDDVTVHHYADENNPATLIKTISLTYYPDKQVAETSDLITLVQPNIVVKGIGMYTDMKTGYVKLLSAARGEYAPSA